MLSVYTSSQRIFSELQAQVVKVFHCLCFLFLLFLTLDFFLLFLVLLDKLSVDPRLGLCVVHGMSTHVSDIVTIKLLLLDNKSIMVSCLSQ